MGVPPRAIIFSPKTDNLLPDSNPIRRRLAERVRAEGDDAYSLLTAIGRDCVGALQFLPGDEEPKAIGKPQGEIVSDDRVAAILADLVRTPLGVSAEEEQFRISIAGAQEKTALLYWKGHWCIPHGSTPTTHILKPQIGPGIDLSKSVENEHFCMELARELGLPTAKTTMVDFKDQRVLVVERFDRQWTRDKRLLRLPHLDAHQMPRKKMRLAMSVGDNRHYLIDTVMPRHFVESAENAGAPGCVVREQLKERWPTSRLVRLRASPKAYPLDSRATLVPPLPAASNSV